MPNIFPFKVSEKINQRQTATVSTMTVSKVISYKHFEEQIALSEGMAKTLLDLFRCQFLHAGMELFCLLRVNNAINKSRGTSYSDICTN